MVVTSFIKLKLWKSISYKDLTKKYNFARVGLEPGFTTWIWEKLWLPKFVLISKSDKYWKSESLKATAWTHLYWLQVEGRGLSLPPPPLCIPFLRNFPHSEKSVWKYGYMIFSMICFFLIKFWHWSKIFDRSILTHQN